MPAILESTAAQLPLIFHAETVGWEEISRDDAVALRGGEAGLLFSSVLEEKLIQLNPGLVTAENAGVVISVLEAVPPTREGNREALAWLRGQRTIHDPVERRDRNVTLIDFARPENNRYQVTAEWAYRAPGGKGNRVDVMFLINGVPVAFVENKNPKRADAMEAALSQLRRYHQETPAMMALPQIFNLTDVVKWFYGVTWNTTRQAIFNWKVDLAEATEEEEAEEDEFRLREPAHGALLPIDPAWITYAEAVRSFFAIPRFLALIQDWILFFFKDDELCKTVLRQHQTRAVDKVVARCAEGGKTRGLIWHTQGSGKTFTLITAARKILENRSRFPGATVMLVVDRTELEGQLSGWVERLLGEGERIKVAYAKSRWRLQELLDQDFRGLIVSMIHKFEEIRVGSCVREDFFVLIDEAHRSTAGDLGNFLMAALPKATLIGFSGTPIDKTAQGGGTFKTFGTQDEGGYLDKYSIRESIEDQTTVPLRHALAPSAMRLPKDLLEREFLSLVETEGVSDVEELNRILDRAVHLKAFLKADDRVAKVAAYVARHYRENVEPLGYKAFLVAVDREACAKYKEALDRHLPADYSLAIYTANENDAFERPLVANHQIDSTAEKKARKLFPQAETRPKIFIVTDKLLTGYDAPTLYCMYLDKPMRDHVLLQSVARVNRPFEDERGFKKPCGLIIDFVGILSDLNKALAFDSDVVNGVIQDLDLMLARLRVLMTGPGTAYLARFAGSEGDALVDRLCQEFLDKETRRRFLDFFHEAETLYEILSPSPDLSPFLADYRRLAEFSLVLRNKFGGKTSFWREVAHKTEALVKEHATASGLERLSQTTEFDTPALEALMRSNRSDEAKVINLVQALQSTPTMRQAQLIPIGDRANAVLQRLENRQTTTRQAMEEMEKLLRERVEMEQSRKAFSGDEATFRVFWLLKQEGCDQPEAVAAEIRASMARFPNHATNAEELRQLKADLYRSLLRVVSGKRMIDLAEVILQP